MSLEEAEATLNVSRSADFETIMQAKKSQIRKAGQDLEQTFRVRALALGVVLRHSHSV